MRFRRSISNSAGPATSHDLGTHLDSDLAPVITGVEGDPRSPGFEVVYLNGKRFASLPASMISGRGLSLGVELDTHQVRALAEAADVEAATRVGLRLLAARPRSEHELRHALGDRGHRAAAVDGAMERLRDQGVIDDEAYALHFARVRSDKGHGLPRVLADLRERGVDRELAEKTASTVFAEEVGDPLEKAEEVATKRLRQLADLPVPTRRRRVLAFLTRRGYHGWEVRRMVDRLIGQD